MTAQQDEWDDLMGFLPTNWMELAEQSGALKGLRKDKSAANLLRVMFIHFACGCSLRETALRARASGYFTGSDVALMNRIKKSKDWLRLLCEAMLSERNIGGNFKERCLRIIDGSDVHEPGATGSNWRIHYCMRLPDMCCDYFSITPTKGKNTGESLCRFPVNKGDLLVADRAYSRIKDIAHVHSHEAFICVRLNYSMLPLWTAGEQPHPFQLQANLEKLKVEGACAEWDVQVFDQDAGVFISGRLCAIRKGEKYIEKSHKKCLEKDRKNGRKTRAKTLFINEYIIIFTTFPRAEFSLTDILQIYRLRWQIELVFKRFKSLAKLGHLPKYLDDSAKAWLYGKLLVALLTEKLIALGGALSPWRDALIDKKEPLAGVCFYVADATTDYSPVNPPSQYSIQLG